ncbi:MAG: carbon storage regulator [Planctomycetaceae bacterium]
MLSLLLGGCRPVPLNCFSDAGCNDISPASAEKHSMGGRHSFVNHNRDAIFAGTRALFLRNAVAQNVRRWFLANLGIPTDFAGGFGLFTGIFMTRIELTTGVYSQSRDDRDTETLGLQRRLCNGWNWRENTMLVLSRKLGERILVGDDIAITIVRIGPNNVRVGIEAPRSMNIVREELCNREPVGAAATEAAPPALTSSDPVRH